MVARESEIKSKEELEIRAEVKRRDCRPVPNNRVWFAISNANVAHFVDDDNKLTDKSGVVYRRLVGGESNELQSAETNVIVVAKLNDGKKIFDNKIIRWADNECK